MKRERVIVVEINKVTHFYYINLINKLVKFYKEGKTFSFMSASVV